MRTIVLLALPLMLLSCKVKKDSMKTKDMVKIDSVYHSETTHTYEKETTRKTDTIISLPERSITTDTPLEQPDDTFTIETEDIKINGKVDRKNNTVHHDIKIKEKEIPVKVDETIKERGGIEKVDNGYFKKKDVAIQKQQQKESEPDNISMFAIGMGLSILGILVIAFILFAIKRGIL